MFLSRFAAVSRSLYVWDMRRVAFFLNPLLVDRSNRRSVVDRCAAILRDAGCTVEMQDTLSAFSAGEQAREAVENGFDTIFACGGDGTLFQLLQGVAGSETVMGVIPFGTGNVLAQNLRLPRDPVAAFELQRKGEAVPIPLGEVKCHAVGHASDRSWYFLIAAGLGVHAALMDLAPNGSSKRALGRAAYYSGGVRLLLRHPVQPFDVEMTDLNGEVRRFGACELLGVRVAEINRWRPGGDLCSSQLRIAAVPPTSRLGLSHAMFHALFTQKSNGAMHNGRGLPYPQYEDAMKAVCKPTKGFAYETPLLVEADGEVIGVERATFKMSQKRVRLLWPQVR
jgi:diacylglycerol kinase (ATP)